MVAYLEKSEGSEGTNEDRVRGITATIYRKVKVFVSESSSRRHLKLEDYKGLKTLPTAEIFEQLALMGFIQIFLNKCKGMFFPHKKTFPTPTLTKKLLSNMKRASKGYSEVDIPIFPTMLTTPESSPSRITSSPSLSPQTHPSTSQPPSTPQSNQTTPITKEAAPIPHESPLQSVHSLGRDEGSLSLYELADLYLTVYKVLISDDEEAEEDPSNQGRSFIKELDLDAGISLLGVFSAATTLADAARRRQSVENVQTYTRRRKKVSTGSGGVSTASRLVSIAGISTASELDSTDGVKAKDKGKAIMHESEPPKKIKKRVQVQISVDEELAKKLDEREEVAAKVDQAHDIDWSDPVVLIYHTLQNRPFFMAEVRKSMYLYLKNQSGYKMSHFKGISYEDIRPIFERESSKPVEEIVQQDDVITEQVVKESSKTARGRRKKSLARKRAKETLSEETTKKQKLENDNEKEQLQVYLNIIQKKDNLILNHGNKCNHLDFDRQDVLELYRLVKERIQTESPEDYELLLWGDLKTMMEPNKEDEICRNQQRLNLDKLLVLPEERISTASNELNTARRLSTAA
ncbi:hypothetical protein Tco_1251479 [Tanacetum coccineum]